MLAIPSPFLPCLPHPHPLLDQTPPEAALTAGPFHLRSLLIFLTFWLCCRSKILFAGHHLASLAPGQHVCLCSTALAPHQRHSQGQEHPRQNCAVQRGCCGSGWVSYSLPVKHGSDSPGISLLDLPKSWVIASILHPAIPAAAHTNASLLLDPWQLHTLIITLCSSQKGCEDSSASPCPGWSQDWMGTSALIQAQDCLQPAQQ